MSYNNIITINIPKAWSNSSIETKRWFFRKKSGLFCEKVLKKHLPIENWRSEKGSVDLKVFLILELSKQNMKIFYI